MHLYHYTLSKPGIINQAISGCFSGRTVIRNGKSSKVTEILVARGKILELFECTEESTVVKINSQEVFGVIRSIVSFRFNNRGDKDYIAIGSDSGRIVVLEYNATTNKFVKIHQETYGKTGCRRIVPGQYLAVDPKGRALMIGAIEKQKFVYVFNMDHENRLTISSPLEGHTQHTILFSLIALDTEFDEPQFACIEVNYEGADESEYSYQNVKKMLTIYEFDLGKNTVVRKSTEEIERSSNMLIQVPKPVGGVVVCSENVLTYKRDGHPDIRALIPRRKDMPNDRGLMIIGSQMYVKKTKSDFFFLVQSELGDLYKVTFNYAETNQQDDKFNVASINVVYFDTVPVGTSFLMMRNGLLFVASEFTDHKVYQFLTIQVSTDQLVGEVLINEEVFPVFEPSIKPQHLNLVQEIRNLAPITDFKVMDLFNEGTPQFYCLTGRGPFSSMRLLRYGLPISEIVTAPLDDQPISIWTVKGSVYDPYDKYMIISFADYTMVLSIGEKVEQVEDSGLFTTTRTIYAANIGDSDLIQIHPRGIRQIRADSSINEWDPGNKTIEKAAVNETQVVIALSGGEIIYFEYETITGQLIELEKNDMAQDVACLALGPIPEGHQRTRFLAVGFYDKTVRVLSLGQYDMMTVLSRQALPAEPESLSLIELQAGDTFELFLNIGLSNGVVLRSTVDTSSGDLSDTRTRFLGTKGVKLRTIKIAGRNAILALSSKPWLGFSNQGKIEMIPLSYPTLHYASNFSSEQCPEGLVAITSGDLRILSIEGIGDIFNQQVIPLKHTPRKFVIHEETAKMIVIETDHNTVTESEKNQQNNDEQMRDEEIPPEIEYGSTKTAPNSGKWASYIRVYSPETKQTTDYIELTENEAAFSITTCKFATSIDGKTIENYVIVGTAKDLKLYPSRKCTCGYIRVYRFVDGGKLQLVHKTEVEDVPYAMYPFRGRLLVGVTNMLRIYDLGKKKLLRKCENKTFPNFITSIAVEGNRVYVGDITESFHFVKYNVQENSLTIFADNSTPRWITASALLDYNTIAGADKFGNFFISRLPNDVTDEYEDVNATGKERWVWERGLLNGAPQKATEIVKFYVGDMITSMTKTSLIPGGPTVLIYVTVTGAIGIFIPFTSKKDIDFFTQLEMQLREKNPPLCGRDHLAYRSYYFPVKSVIDGDLIEQYNILDLRTKETIAKELDKKINEISKKIEDIRNQTGI
ncbi:hypothetical protein ABK040_010286 [Willaertia magna]